MLAVPGGSLYGWLRDWMGMEKLSLTVYDDPALFDEMIATVADCILGVLEKVFASGVQFAACSIWEDMAYRAGPLLSPRHFKNPASERVPGREFYFYQGYSFPSQV